MRETVGSSPNWAEAHAAAVAEQDRLDERDRALV
jgi:hypothetical protein